MASGLTVRSLTRRGARGRPRGTFRRIDAVALGGAIAVALLLTGCTTTGHASASDPRLQGTWQLTSARDHGRAIPLGGTAITLTIGDSTHTGGDSPCSSYSATVIGGVGVVYISAQLNGGTRDDCASTQLNVLEKNYLDALTATRYAAIDSGHLVLSSGASNLVYARAVQP